MTKRSVTVILPALTARQAESLIDALNSVVGQLWDAYGEDIRIMHDGEHAKDIEFDQLHAAPPSLDEDEPW